MRTESGAQRETERTLHSTWHKAALWESPARIISRPQHQLRQERHTKAICNWAFWSTKVFTLPQGTGEGGVRIPGTELRGSARPCTVIRSIPAQAREISGSPRLPSTRGYRGTWPSREGQQMQHHSKGYIMARSILKELVAGSNSLFHPKYRINQANSRTRERH